MKSMRKLFSVPIAVLVSVVAFFGVFTAPASAEDGARIHLIHGIPGVNVDVEAGGEVVFADFAFKDTQDLSGLAGETLADLKVKLAGTDDVAIDAGDVTLPAKGNYTIFAHLDAEGTPALAVFENDVSKIDAGKGRIVVRHAAQAPAVDIKANGSVAFENVANGAQGQADLATGTISVEVVPTGTDSPVVIGPADLPINEGESLVVYAAGSLDDGLEVITESITDLHSTPSAVHTGDSPVNATGTSTLLLMVASLGALMVAAGLALRPLTSRVRQI